MNTKLATATLGAALILAGAPGLASAADNQAGPIHIYKLQLSGGYSMDGNGDHANILPGGATISFSNQYSAAATRVVFALETAGYVVDRFSDVGSFATGVMINHRFPETDPQDNMRVAVESATFADGTVWLNPEVPHVAAVDTTVGVAASPRY